MLVNPTTLRPHHADTAHPARPQPGAAAYLHALASGYSPFGAPLDADTLQAIRDAAERDAGAFLAGLANPHGAGEVVLADGQRVPSLPMRKFWLYDGDFAGEITLRWQPGRADMPAYCPGHTGYAVLPAKRGRGYAARALRLLLPHARAVGLPWLEIAMACDNIASWRSAQRAGAVRLRRFLTDEELGRVEAYLYRLPY